MRFLAVDSEERGLSNREDGRRENRSLERDIEGAHFCWCWILGGRFLKCLELISAGVESGKCLVGEKMKEKERKFVVPL